MNMYSERISAWRGEQGDKKLRMLLSKDNEMRFVMGHADMRHHDQLYLAIKSKECSRWTTSVCHNVALSIADGHASLSLCLSFIINIYM